MAAVEMMGLPGSGKSTIINAISNEKIANSKTLTYSEFYSLDKSKYLYKLNHLIQVSKWLLGNPNHIHLLLKVLTYEASDARTRILKYTDLCARTQLHSSQNEIVLLDQGPFQALWSLLATECKLDDRQICTLITELYPGSTPEVLCYLKIPAEEAVDRFTTRKNTGETQFDHLDSTVLYERYEKATRVFSRLLKAAKEVGISIVELSALRPAAWNASLLEEKISALPSGKTK